jgi:hypothetical protein
MKKIGFTGTRRGMTEAQKDWFWEFLRSLGVMPFEFHHGDCEGADHDAHRLASELTHCRIVIHPPIKKFARMFLNGDEIRPVKDFLDRNKDIVNETEILVGMPGEDEEQLRSGTWSTIRYARKSLKPTRVVGPSGNRLDLSLE